MVLLLQVLQVPLQVLLVLLVPLLLLVLPLPQSRSSGVGGEKSSDVFSGCLVCLFVVVWVCFCVWGWVGLGWVSFGCAPMAQGDPRLGVVPGTWKNKKTKKQKKQKT